MTTLAPQANVQLIDPETGRATAFFLKFLGSIAGGGTSLQGQVETLQQQTAANAQSITILNSEVASIETALALLPTSRLLGSAAFTPGLIANGALVSTTVTVTGAVLGQEAAAAFNHDLLSVTLWAYVSAVDTVTAVFLNETGAGVTLAAGTVRGFVWTP